MKSINLIAVCAILALTGCGSEPASQPTATGPASPAEAPVETRADAPPNPDMTGLVAQVDTDKDGRMSEAEWKAQGLPGSSFEMLEKGRGYVTIADYQANAAPPGIDINGDGKLTVAEFKEFDRRMAARMKGPPPAGPQ